MATAFADEHFARVAPHYRSVRVTDEQPVVEMAACLPARPLRGLEVGCGTGRYTELLLEHLGAGSSIVTVDACWQMVEMLRRTAGPEPNLRPLCGDAADLPLKDGSVEFVATFNAVHHFDLERFMAGAARLLRPGGRLFVYTRTPDQNAGSVWGRLFPGFSEKEDRLPARKRLEAAVGATPGLHHVDTREYAFRRREPAAVLAARVRARAYSTFSLYGEEELTEALDGFLGALRSDPVEWTDRNTLVTGERR